MLLQTQNLSIRPLTTAHLAQTMTLLELTSEELSQKVEAALASNPALELLDPARCPHCRRILPHASRCPVCRADPDANPERPIVFVSPALDFTPTRKEYAAEEPVIDEWLTAIEDLPTYILRQIAPELTPQDRPLAAHLLTSLNEDGLLEIPLSEISRYHHVPLSRVEQVQRLIQHADPVGVGSNTPQEALLVQLECLADTQTVPSLAAEAVRTCMDLLGRRAYQEMARRLGITTAEAVELASFIADNLNPFPARAHWGELHTPSSPTPVYQNADIIISRLNGTPDTPLVVEIISPYSGSLRVNPIFRQAIQQAPLEKSEQWQADLDEASLLVKCMQQRDHTLIRLMKRLVVIQREFILRGDAYLAPITRAQLAKELDVHESTISRAVSDKAVQLPNQKIIPLSKWFDRSLHIRTALMEIIAQEGQPLSDTQIANLLIQQGFSVARRTVAKYRAMEGILPARLRQPAMVSNAS